MSFKEQLKNEILPKTVDYYNSGMDINSSIVKAAQDFKLNLDQTDRLMETMNTARVIAHYEKNAEDRTANCDIADKNIIRKMLYGDKPAEKTAGVVQGSEFGDYSSYFEADRNYRLKSRIEKVASALPSEPEKTREFTNAQAYDKVAKYARDIEMQRKFAEERVEIAKAHVATNLSKIASSLSRGYEPERRYALFKSACLKSCPLVVKSVDSEISQQIVKDATVHMKQLRRANVVDSSSVDAEISLARDTEDDISKVADMEVKVAACRKHEQWAKGVIRKYAEAVKVARPGPPLPPPSSGGGGSGGSGGSSGGKGSSGSSGGSSGGGDKNKKSDPWIDAPSLINVSNPALAGAKQTYDYLQGGFLSGDLITEALKPEKPKPDVKLKDYISNIQRSALISDLYREDPILSEADPAAVTRAYEAFIQTAPEASLNKEVVRAVLRQSVNSVAISPYDAKQWMDLDSTRAEIAKNKAQAAKDKATLKDILKK